MSSASIPNTFSNTPAGTNVIDATQVNANFSALLAGVNSVDETQLANAVLQRLSLNNGAQVGRGKSIIATTEARTNVAYGTLTTPDQVTGVVLPTDGLIVVAYEAIWQCSVAHAGLAAVFIGANQLKIGQNNLGAPTVQEAGVDNNAATDQVLASGPAGLIQSGAGAGATAYTGDVTTGQIVGNNSYAPGGGGPMYLFAAAGTYTVSVQFRATSGSVTAKNRKLWVWSMAF